MAKETTKGQLIFRWIFLIFIFGWDIISYLTETFDITGDNMMLRIVLLVFFGPLFLVYLTTWKNNLGTLLKKVTGYSVTNDISSTGSQQVKNIYNDMISSTTHEDATTVTWEKVNPYSINGK
jgi:hypothetical protein